MEWKEVRLGDVCEIKGGKRLPKGINLITQKNSHPYIRVRDLGKSKTLELNSSYEYVDEITQKQIQRYITLKGDILISIVGTIGLIAIVGGSLNGANLTENCVKLVKLDNIDSEYLYYYLKSPLGQQNISRGTVGAVQAKLPIKNIQEFNINCPVLISDQRRIASILSSLDRKIELNNKINADLEEMAQAIFKNWFVDFEPFKDGKFVDSELGMIPEGWKVGTIGDIVEFQNGFTFSSKDFSENGEYKIITIKSVQDGCLVTEGSSKVTEYPTKMPAYCKLQSGDILLSLTGNVGRCCLVTETNLLLNQRVAKIKAKECYDNSFSYALFRLKETKELLISISRGTAQANLSPVEASKLPMVIPSEDARKSFSMISDSIMNKIISIHIENSRLSLLRDTLLPRLMSGELEVPE